MGFVLVLICMTIGVLGGCYCKVWIDDTTGNDEWI